MALKKETEKKATAKKGAGKIQMGEAYTCEVCGLGITIDEVCGCVETCDIICCQTPMKKKKGKK